ncbi:MAG: S16 family serine protease [Verrucomicrobiales bacterium]
MHTLLRHSSLHILRGSLKNSWPLRGSLAFFLALALAACGPKESPETNNSDSQGTNPESPQQTSSFAPDGQVRAQGTDGGGTTEPSIPAGLSGPGSGQNLSGQASPTALTERRESTVNFVYFTGEPGTPQARGGAAPVSVRVEPNPSREPSVGVMEEFASGTGNMWRTAAWMAAFNSSMARGESIAEHEFLVRVGGHVDGPSAGMLITTVMLALLNGDDILPNTTMSGTINPDGSCGPVGGLPQKMQGAKDKGLQRFGFPVGSRQATDLATGQMVDLQDLGRRLGLAEVREIRNLDDAYEFFTGKKLPQETPLSESEMELAGEQRSHFAAKSLSLKGRSEAKIPLVENRLQQLPEEMLEPLAQVFTQLQSSQQQQQTYASSGYEVAAYLKQLEVYILLRFLEHQIDLYVPLLQGDMARVDAQIRSLQATRTTAEAFAMEAQAMSRKQTIGGRLNAVSGMGTYAMALVRMNIGDNQLALANQILEGMGNGTLDSNDSEVVEQLYTSLGQAVFNYSVSEVFIEFARDWIGVAVEEGPRIGDSIDHVVAFGRAYGSAAGACLGYFDAVVTEPEAQTAGVTMDQMRDYLGNIEFNYPFINFAAQFSEHARQVFPNEPYDQAILQLGYGMNAFLGSANLVNKYYCLSATIDPQGNVVLGNRRALAAQLDLARQRTLQVAAHCKRELGFVPSAVSMQYQLGIALREGNDEDKLQALDSFWMATSYGNLALVFAR